MVLRANEVPTLPMPPICARTGQPAGKAVKVTITKTPWWAWLGVLGGLLVLLVLALVASKRCEVRVPHARSRGVRRSLAAVGVVVGAFAEMFGVLFLIFEPGPASLFYNVVAGGVLAGCVWAYRDATCGGRWADDEHVVLTRLHPAFAAALQQAVDARREHERRAALAGWHPDPSGQAALRWFDGYAWTQHVSGPAAAYHS